MSIIHSRERQDLHRAESSYSRERQDRHRAESPYSRERQDRHSRAVIAERGKIAIELNCHSRGEKAKELLMRAADLGFSHAHFLLGNEYRQGGYLKKAKFHYETAAMAGHEVARYILGCFETKSGNREQALKHLRIAASAGEYQAMHTLQMIFEVGGLSP